jgi:hypothetical protein
VAAGFDASTEALSAFKKLFQRHNWLLGGPALIGQIAGFIFGFIAAVAAMGPAIWQGAARSSSQAPVAGSAQTTTFVIAIALAIVLAMLINALMYGWTLVAADPVWAGGDPAFDRGFSRAISKWLQMAAFQLLLLGMIVVSLITIVGPIVIAVLAIYGPPFILFGGRSATQAIADSFRLASRNIGETLWLVLWLALISIGAFIPLLILGLIPVIGMFTQLAIQGLLNGFIALAVVRFYTLLTITSDVPPSPATPVATTH